MTRDQEGRQTLAKSGPFRSMLRGGAARIGSFSAAASVFIAVFTCMSLFARHHWLADICANLRVQWVIALRIVGLVSVATRRWKLLAVQCLLLVIHAPWFVSAFSQEQTSPGPAEFTVASVNVFTPNRRFDDIEAEMLRSNADIVAVVELSPPLSRHLSGAFSERYPYSRLNPQGEGNFGIGLYSREPFSNARVEYFNDERLTSIVARLEIRGTTIAVIATHTLPPMGPGNFAHRNRHLRMLAEKVQEFRQAEPEVPVIVLGDLNLTPWSPIFQDFTTEAALVPATSGQRVTPTWYRFSAFPFGLVLDHILTTSNLNCTSYLVGQDIGSDHRMVTATLKLVVD